MGNIDVKIIIQLWQIIFTVILSAGALLTLGISLATLFVRRKEFDELKQNGNVKYDKIESVQNEIFALIREIKVDVGILRGENSALH